MDRKYVIGPERASQISAQGHRRQLSHPPPLVYFEMPENSGGTTAISCIWPSSTSAPHHPLLAEARPAWLVAEHACGAWTGAAMTG